MSVGLARRLPTLTGRVLRAFALAMLVVWLVLVTVQFAGFKHAIAQRQAQREAARGLGEALQGLTPEQAALVARASEIQINRSRAQSGVGPLGDVLFQLLASANGAELYRSAMLSSALLPAGGDIAPDRWALPGGRAYWTTEHAAGAWRVRLYEPVLDDGRALAWIAQDMTPSFLLALPLIALPLWWALRRGLAPLRRLAEAVRTRHPGDFAPLKLDLRLADLQPIETALDELLARARDGVARERAFVQDAAHELRTPMAVIAAQAHLLAESDDAQARQLARAGLERGIHRSAHLVDQLLALARLDDDSPASRDAPMMTVDLVTVAQQAMADAAASPLATPGVQWQLLAPPALRVLMPPGLAETMLHNLLDNALRHAAGARRVQVTIGTCGASPARAALTVRDDGPGVTPGQRARLFERFYRAGGASGTGTGLGLAIVQAVAQQLGGQAEVVEGLEGRGLGIHLTWPMAPGQGSAAVL